MKMWQHSAFLAAALAAVSSVAAHAQLDISASYYEAFTSSSAGNGTKQTPTNSGVEMVEARYLVNRLAGIGMSYSYNKANQTFTPNGSACALLARIQRRLSLPRLMRLLSIGCRPSKPAVFVHSLSVASLLHYFTRQQHL